MDTKDNITQFNTGAIRDTQDGKLDFVETMAWMAIAEYSKYMTAKKAKYGSGNFHKGIPVESYQASLMRHIVKYLCIAECRQRGVIPPAWMEAHEDHLCAVIFNTLGIIYEESIKTCHTADGGVA